MIKILRGVEKFDSGCIIINNKKITSNFTVEEQKYLRKNTAIHIQRNFGLWSGPAIDNIIRRLNYNIEGVEALPSKDHYNYDSLYQEALSILKLVNLEDKALHSTDQLSGGEKQRLVLARQIAAKPKILLLDEPVTMTGPDTKQEILDMILNLNKKLNITIIIVSHLPEVHLYVSSCVIYIDKGAIVNIGTPLESLNYFKKELKPKESLSILPVINDTCINAINISKRYSLIRVGEVLNLKDINISVLKGEVIALIGRSGSGKTTLLKIIEGLLEPIEGIVEYIYSNPLTNKNEIIDILKYSDNRIYLRSRISIMNQEFSLSMNSTILEQIKYRYKLKNKNTIDIAIKKAKELSIPLKTLDLLYKIQDMTSEEKDQIINNIGIPDEIISILFPLLDCNDISYEINNIFKVLDLPLSILNRKPNEISGGEHVRAFIALSLITNPDYLLLDEPFGDLDPITLREVTNSLKRINKIYGTTIFLVSHHMDFVKEVSHRSVLIHNGNIQKIGNSTEVCNLFINDCKASYLIEGSKIMFK